jgi:hypothetical protein
MSSFMFVYLLLSSYTGANASFSYGWLLFQISFQSTSRASYSRLAGPCGFCVEPNPIIPCRARGRLEKAGSSGIGGRVKQKSTY